MSPAFRRRSSASSGNDLFEELFYNYQSVAVALIVFGVAFIAVETAHKDKPAKINSLNELTYPTVLMIGMFQLIAAIFPGTSRSGSTIVGALLLGVSRTVAAEFTFFLAIPVMFGASLLKLVKFGLVFTQTEMIILAIGMVTAFVSSMLIIRMLMAFVKSTISRCSAGTVSFSALPCSRTSCSRAESSRKGKIPAPYN